jgi:hypothetical protein
MSTGVFTRVGKDAFQKLRVYRDFGGASVKNATVGPVTQKVPIHQAVQAAITHVEFLETDSLSGTPLNTKLTNASRDTDPYLAQHIRDLQKVYFGKNSV